MNRLKAKIDKPFAGDEGYHVLISLRDNHYTSAGCMSLEDIEELRDQLSTFLLSKGYAHDFGEALPEILKQQAERMR